MQNSNKFLVLDVESTIFKKGSPFSRRNRLCAVGLFDGTTKWIFNIEHGDSPYGDKLGEIQRVIDDADVLVGFNLKFDLHWLRRYGIKFTTHAVYDCQLAEFINCNQQGVMPSLENTCTRYNLLGKSGPNLATKYWDRGIDTPEIPWGELSEYLAGDLEATYGLLLHLKSVLPVSKQALINLHMQDLLVLEEMEANGEKFDVEFLDRGAERTRRDLRDIDDRLKEFTGGIGNFNPDSPEQVSYLLYGGTYAFDVATPYEHTFKSGDRAGETITRYKHTDGSLVFERRCTPLPRTELKKPGLWSTEEGVLRSLKADSATRKLIDLLLLRSEQQKLLGTYYEGIPKLITEMDWEPQMAHGQLNQCVAITGRLSSSKPNKQNIDKRVLGAITSRFLTN